MILDITKGVCETDQYKAWKFPGGEIHVKLKKYMGNCVVISSYHFYLQIYKNNLRKTKDFLLF